MHTLAPKGRLFLFSFLFFFLSFSHTEHCSRLDCRVNGSTEWKTILYFFISWKKQPGVLPASGISDFWEVLFLLIQDTYDRKEREGGEERRACSGSREIDLHA